MAHADDPGASGLRASTDRHELRRVRRSRGGRAQHGRPGRGSGARRQGVAGAERSPHRPGQAAGPCRAGDRCRAPSSDRNRPALRLQHPGRDRHRARPAPLCGAARFRRLGGLSVPGLRSARRPDPHRRSAGRSVRSVQVLPQGHLQGPAEDPVEDGHLHRGLLPRCAAVRGGRPGR
ncbi:hypothetical protein D3C84_517390 [compost metagenome]